MVKTTRVQETVSVTMIWQYVDSLYVNRVCVLHECVLETSFYQAHLTPNCHCKLTSCGSA